MTGHSAGEVFGVRKLACAFGEIYENRAVLKSGSKLPHSESFSCKNYAAVSVSATPYLLRRTISLRKA